MYRMDTGCLGGMKKDSERFYNATQNKLIKIQ